MFTSHMTCSTFSPICRNLCVCERACCHARLERCWSDQADGIWPYPGVLWHVGIRDSKLNGQELVHMAVRRLMCQHCICNSSSAHLRPHCGWSYAPSISGHTLKTTLHILLKTDNTLKYGVRGLHGPWSGFQAGPHFQRIVAVISLPAREFCARRSHSA